MNKQSVSTSIFSIILVTVILLASVLPAISTPTLNLTVATDKQEYGSGENVYISGNLTLDGSPVEDALVAVEVRDSEGDPFVFRTRPTGPITEDNWLVNYTVLYPCNSNGDPKYSFNKGENLWVFLTVRNFDTVGHYVIICIVVYDANFVPLGAWYPSWGLIDPNSSKTVFVYLTQIPNSASVGNATIYANAYSGFPKDGGFPYCPEKTATFTITTSTSSSHPPSTTQSRSIASSVGNYDLLFKTPSIEVHAGNYTVYVSSYYQEQLVTNNTTFKITIIGDINGDGVVDIFDAILLAAAFGSTPDQPNWDERADLNGDNIVDIFDAIIFSTHFGEGAA